MIEILKLHFHSIPPLNSFLRRGRKETDILQVLITYSLLGITDYYDSTTQYLDDSTKRVHAFYSFIMLTFETPRE